MDLRRRRKTYAREMAAKQAHERISKFERLKKVKSTAKRQASKFTRKLSRTMSRKNTEPQSDEELQVLSLIQLYSFPVGRMSLPWKKGRAHRLSEEYSFSACDVSMMCPCIRCFLIDYFLSFIYIEADRRRSNNKASGAACN